MDAIHVSSGSFFPHPRNPAGGFPVAEQIKSYDSMLSSGQKTFRNYLLFRGMLTRKYQRSETDPEKVEGINLADARAIKKAVRILVICTGGFQTASVIVKALTDGSGDAVSIARSLIANNDLVQYFSRGEQPPKPCTYCNKCLVNVVENPLGCYDETRFNSSEEMVRQIMSVFDPPPFP